MSGLENAGSRPFRVLSESLLRPTTRSHTPIPR